MFRIIHVRKHLDAPIWTEADAALMEEAALALGARALVASPSGPCCRGLAPIAECACAQEVAGEHPPASRYPDCAPEDKDPETDDLERQARAALSTQGERK